MEKKIALNYVFAINASDIKSLYALMADDFIFIDAHDNKVIGKDEMSKSWLGYFDMFPDYKIEVTEIIKEKSLMCIFGYASGTYKNLKNETNSNYWRVPAAWKVIVENGKVKHWQVYADNIFPVEIINRNEETPYPLNKLGY